MCVWEKERETHGLVSLGPTSGFVATDRSPLIDSYFAIVVRPADGLRSQVLVVVVVSFYCVSAAIASPLLLCSTNKQSSPAASVAELLSGEETYFPPVRSRAETRREGRVREKLSQGAKRGASGWASAQEKKEETIPIADDRL